MKKLILIILVIGAFLIACGGGGQTAELPPEEGAKPAEVSVPTSVAEATLVPTAAPTATPVPTPIPEPEPSPEYGPPPIIQLTVVYPDGGSLVVPIRCPVPGEFCETGVEIFDADGNYLGLGFSLPKGTPIFAIVAGEHIETIRAFQTFDYKTGDYAYFRRIEKTPRSKEFHYIPNLCTDSAWFRYDYSGFSDFDTVFDRFHLIRPEAGEGIGRVNDPGSSLLGKYRYRAVYGADGQEIDGVNFILWVKTWWGNYSRNDCEDAMLRIHFDCQPAPIPESTPESVAVPTLTVALSNGSEVPIACPVPAEFCQTATEIFRDNGSFLSLGFSLPEGTSVLAVADGKVEQESGTVWRERYYPIRYTLTTEGLSFHYSLVDDSLFSTPVLRETCGSNHSEFALIKPKSPERVYRSGLSFYLFPRWYFRWTFFSCGFVIWV